jgi:host cell surface-exposed lipoprotein
MNKLNTLMIVAAFAGGALLMTACGEVSPGATAATVAPVATTKPVVATPTPVPTAMITTGQANARASAAQYLSIMPFSRAGLIQQLSSSAGAGFSVADATYGVDSLNTDWNAQAALSAKQYLSTMPFSRAGLIQQLSSSAGAGFTYAQAVYGVTAAGL